MSLDEASSDVTVSSSVGLTAAAAPAKSKFIIIIRMHSSRMRTARSSPYGGGRVNRMNERQV